MAFTINGAGTIITQTGTDTNMSGLSGLGTLRTSSGGDHTSYHFGTIIFRINGTCSIDPEREMLTFGNHPAGGGRNFALQINVGGVFNVGTQETINGDVKYSKGIALHFNRTGFEVVSNTQGDIGVFGTLNWNGGDLLCRQAIVFDGNSNVTLREGNFIGTNATESNRVRQRSNNFQNTKLFCRRFYSI